MKLFAFEGAETDWVAATDEAGACRALMTHYGIGPDDIADSYESISEVDAGTVVFTTDETDIETEEPATTTAAAMMHGKTNPFLVGSTFDQ